MLGGGGGFKTFSAALVAMAPTTGGMSQTKGKGIIFPPNRENVVSTPVLSFFFEGGTRPSSDRYKGQIRQIRHIGILCPSAVVLKERKRTLPELCYTDTRCQTFVDSISS